MRAKQYSKRRLPPYCVEDVDRFGNVRVYLRKKGRPKTRLFGTPYTPSFMSAYEKALDGEPAANTKHVVKRVSWRWLCEQYFRSPEFNRLSLRTGSIRRRILEATFEKKILPERSCLGDFPFAQISRKIVVGLRDDLQSKSEASNARLKALRQVFKFATDREFVAVDPSHSVKYFPAKGDGFHTWTIEEIKTFQKYHPIGTQANLALALLLNLGVRRSDVVLLGRQHVKNGVLTFKPQKTKHLSDNELKLPILPDLQHAFDAIEHQHLTFLITAFGKPFSAAGFGNRFKKWCAEAGLPHCSAHGLRKAAATIASENGATERQLMAIFGWRNSKMASHYTKKASQFALARDAMRLIEVPPSDSGGTLIQKV
ncbi:MAG TPA: site-specific integrase [Rhizomicrobium sp.]